jgi:hypothetical protein
LRIQAATAEMRKLEERKQLRIDALLYRKIDQNTYDQQHEKLRIALEATEARLGHAELEQIDIEEVLAYAEHCEWLDDTLGQIGSLSIYAWQAGTAKNTKAY